MISLLHSHGAFQLLVTYSARRYDERYASLLGTYVELREVGSDRPAIEQLQTSEPASLLSDG